MSPLDRECGRPAPDEGPAPEDPSTHHGEVTPGHYGARPAIWDAPRLRHLDWRWNAQGRKPRPCRLCDHPTLLRDERGRPTHKTCAEAEAVRQAHRVPLDAQ